jgi:hypothetical protein
VQSTPVFDSLSHSHFGQNRDVIFWRGSTMQVKATFLKWLPYALIAAAVLIFFIGEHMYFARVSFFEEEIANISPLQDKELQTFLEMTRILLTLATAAIAALGGFLLSRHGAVWPTSSIALMIATVALAAWSIYFGYFSFDSIRWMLHNNFFNLSNPYVVWPQIAQFWTFLLSVILFAIFVFRGVRRA